jgi:hypothetical protein
MQQPPFTVTLLVALGCGLATAPAKAQQPPAATAANDHIALADGWQFNAATFLWAPSISGNITLRGRSFDSSVGALDVLRKSDSVFGYMGNFEAENDRFGVFLQPIWMRLGFTSPAGVLNSKITTDLTFIEFGGFYRALQGMVDAGRPWFIDAMGGVRLTSMSVSASFALGPSLSQTRTWVDPFVGARGRLQFAPRWDVELRGDVGGFGVGSQVSLNTYLLLGYRFTLFGHPAEAFGGYKAQWQDYRSGGFGWDNVLHGPLLGLNVTF